ncbi:hypothetical protein B0H63DRAFT_128800 [Podospora didyma]|uniref:Zn(2)-C6 fungal-type domain-containing protein n=1 Tax=Podospora didyma TaxID=330526 RepID=A0AAE0P059_9PEZI|nr:hypothetical protein B0H63DRAFT_128800 [Podospora didyma]
MPRKGTQKVKTGCFTCKQRKVKCDETKPHCLRCTSHGRACGGYPAHLIGAYSWAELLSKQVVPAITDRRTTQEGRALEFYRSVVAPVFSGYSDGAFWSHLVVTASYQEPAVRHAVIAISSIYEQMVGEQAQHAHLFDSPRRRFAIGHYNRALQQLTKTDDEGVVLFVCVLFVCIEILQENKDAAIDHVRHGVVIFNNSKASSSVWARSQLLPMFIRLSIFPFFFGGTVDTFPGISEFDADLPGIHTALEASRFRLDLLVARCVRFIRSVDPYREWPLSHEPISETLRTEQQTLSVMLDEWLHSFSAFRTTNPPPNSDAEGLYMIMQMKGLVGKIWVSTCADRNEMAYDSLLVHFQEIVAMAGLAVKTENNRAANLDEPALKPKFIFEMGYLPLLYFVVIKCRDLPTRLAALEYMTALSFNRECLWDSVLMFSIAWRIIELEHCVDRRSFEAHGSYLDPAEYGPDTVLVPPEEMRIKDSKSIRDAEFRQNRYLQAAPHCKVTFLVWGPDGQSRMIDEWVEIRPPVPRGQQIYGLEPYEPTPERLPVIEDSIYAGSWDD